MKRSVKIILSVFSLIMALVCVFCVLYIIQYIRGNELNARLADENASGMVFIPREQADAAQTAPEENAEQAADNAADEKQSLRSVDFAALNAINGDIYAWLEMPGTVINYAVLQSDKDRDQEYYSDHAADGSYYSGGSIFSQSYNALDFSDPVTVLYGHNRKNGTMFAELNSFADPAFFAEHGTVYVYLPEVIYEYSVFAAYPHSSEHLLLCHDFNDEAEFNEYFAALKDGVNTNYARELFPEFGDKVLTLSTCYKQNRMQRYIVQAKLVARYSLMDNAAE